MKYFVCAAIAAASLFVNLAGAKTSVAAPAPPYSLVNKIPLTGADGWDYLCVDSKNRRLYVSRSTHVDVINVDTHKIVGTIPGLSGVHGIAIDPISKRGFTSNGRSNSVTIFDIKSLKKLAEVQVGEGPDAIVFDPASERVFTFNGHAQTSTAIDSKTGKVAGTINLPGRPEFAASDGKGHIYDAIEDKNEVVEIDTRTLKIENTWPIAPGTGPSGLAVDAKTRRVFAVCDNQVMIILDADHGNIVATPKIGDGPDACVYDSKRHRVFSPNGRDGAMTILQQSGPSYYHLLATVPTQKGARTMALDEKTGHVFTISATALPAAPGEQPWRRRYADGSIVVLEYAP